MLYIPVGPPGCGKSTLADNMVARGIFSPDAIVSPDHYRWVLSGDIMDQTKNKQVFEICDRILQIRLQQGLDVFIDATNLTNWEYSANTATDYGQEFHIITFPVLTLEQLMERQESRGRTIPIEDMQRMIERYDAVLASIYLKGWVAFCQPAETI